MFLSVAMTILALNSVSDFEKPIHLVNHSQKVEFVSPMHQAGSAITYEEILDEAIHGCKNVRPENVDVKLLKTLIEIEKSFNPPSSMRGMLLAAACMESGYNPKAKGDTSFSKNKKTPMAIGILQQWPIYEKAYGTNRTDPKSSAETWMKHIVRQIPKIKKQCRYRTEKRIWLAAWVTGIRYKKEGGRCAEVPKHYRLLKKWHRMIKKTRKEAGIYEREGRGC